MRAVLRFVANQVGGKLRKERRRELADALESHDLTEEEFEDLKPYAGVAVDCTGLSGLWGLIGHALFALMGVGAIWVFWSDGFHPAIPAAIGAVLLYVCYESWVRLQFWLTARELRGRLTDDPRSVLSDDGYESVVAKWEKRTDLTKVYPGTVDVDPTIETPDSILSG